MKPSTAIGTCLIAVLTTDALAQQPDLIKPTVAWTTKLDPPSFGGAAVADVDQDGRLEVAFGTYFGDDSVRMLNGEDGSELWRYDAGKACLAASLRFVDTNDDQKLELVIPVSNKGQILSFEAATGKELWKYEIRPTPRSPKRLPLVLSEQEVRRLLEAAPRIHDKLLLGRHHQQRIVVPFRFLHLRSI